MPNTDKVAAIVLAGGDLERERFPSLRPEIARKAAIPVLGRPLNEWTVAALRAVEAIGPIVVIGDSSLASPALEGFGAELVPERGTITGNLRQGLDCLLDGGHLYSAKSRVLVVSGDLPLLNPKSVRDLLEHSPEADLVFPILERSDTMAAFPSREWIFAKTADGAFTGCSAAVIKPGPVLENWRWVEELLEARRKKPLALAMMFGLPFALKLLTGRLRIGEAEARLSRLLHVHGRAYRTRFVELAMDVDKETDLPLVEEVLRRRSAETGLRSQADQATTPHTQRED